MNNRLIVITSLIAVGIATRFFAPLPNFTAVGAAALLGGALFKGNYKAFLIPVITLFLSDIVINNVIYGHYYSSFQLISPGFGATYTGFIAIVLIGRLGIKSYKPGPIASSAVAGAIVFYLISNFGVWLGSTTYAATFSGLVSCYVAALPFLLNQILGNLVYSAILFAAAFYLLGEFKVKKVNA